MTTTAKKRTGRKPTQKRRKDAEGKVTVAGKRANGEGSVYWSASAGRWEAAGRHPVTGKRVKRTGSTREQAADRLAAALGETTSTGVDGLGPSPTFAAVLAWFLDQIAAPRVSASTLTTYRKQAVTLGPLLGDRLVADLTKADAVTVTNALFAAHSHDWASGCRRLAKRALGEAIDLGYVTVNVFDRVAVPERPEVERRYLTLDEQRRLVTEALDPKYRHGVAVALLFTLGLRVSEVLGLRWDDLGYQAETVTIARAVTYRDGHGPVVGATKTRSTRGTRHLPKVLHAPLRRLERSQKAERLALGPHRDPEGEGFCFVGVRHQLTTRQTITKEVARICLAVGIDPVGLGTHGGRRTVVTNLYAAGEVTEDIAAAVGHADPATTRGYVQSLGNRPTATAKKMGALLTAKPKPTTRRRS